MAAKYLLFLSKILLVLILPSCKTALPVEKNSTSLLGEKMPHFLEFMKSKNLRSLQSGCQIYDENLRLSYSLTGDLCIFEPDGSTVISYRDKLQKYDDRFNLLWSLNLFVTHQLKLSEDRQNYLAIVSQYYPTKTAPVRYDELKVISKDGKILKSFSFWNLPQFKGHAPTPNSWTSDGFKDKSLEISHVNSISEFFKTNGSKKVLAGYLSANAGVTLAMVLSTDLKPVKTFVFKGSSIHDIQQLNSENVLFYSNFRNSTDHRSFIGVVNLNQGEKNVFYQNKLQDFSGKACGSVQQLDDSKLLILHSNCDGSFIGKSGSAKMEFVDLKADVSEALEVSPNLLLPSIKSVNLTSFFEKNIGR